MPPPEDPFSYYPPVYARIFQVILSPGFPTKILYAALLPPMRATCAAPLIPIDLITRTIFGKLYRSVSSSLYSLFY